MTRTIFTIVVILFSLLFNSCATQPAVIIDTTPVDNVILDVSDTAGDIETQVITVHDTITKVIYEASSEDKAKIEKQFTELYLSIAHLKTLPSELARLHSVEIGKLAAEIKRLQPFEVESEKQKALKWKAYAVLGIIGAIATAYIAIKVFKLF